MKSKIKFQPALSLLVLLLLTGLTPAHGASGVRVNFRQTTLKNGLRVITVEDRSAPVVAVAVTYAVGSRNERVGKSGFAHLLEHLMFRGSENVRADEHAALVQSFGGTVNAWTEKDLTTYFMTLPANQLDLALFLEADRMRGLNITESNLRTERAVVAREEREKYERPFGRSLTTLEQAVYNSFAYKHPTLGSMSELNAASAADVKAFYELYYAPNNAVLTLVGDFSTAAALRKVNAYFARIARRPMPPPVDADEPEQREERRLTIRDEQAQVSRIDIAFDVSAASAADIHALQVIAILLHQSKQSSRLFQRLTVRQPFASNVEGRLSAKCGPAVFYLSVTLTPQAQVAEVEAAIYDEIEKLKQESVGDEELQKPTRFALTDLYQTMRNALRRAIELGESAATCRNPDLINTRVKDLARVSSQDVMRATRLYLSANNRTVLITMPKSRAP